MDEKPAADRDPPLLEARGISKYFGAITALDSFARISLFSSPAMIFHRRDVEKLLAGAPHGSRGRERRDQTGSVGGRLAARALASRRFEHEVWRFSHGLRTRLPLTIPLLRRS